MQPVMFDGCTAMRCFIVFMFDRILLRMMYIVATMQMMHPYLLVVVLFWFGMTRLGFALKVQTITCPLTLDYNEVLIAHDLSMS
jgi:hypothetical protein